MSDATSALPGAQFDGLARVSETGLQGMITLRGDLGSKPLKAAAKSVTGLDLPEPTRITTSDTHGIGWMSPDELLILCPHAEVATHLGTIAKALTKQHHLAVDVSDARALFRVCGPAAREVLAKLCPVDLAPGAFTPGMFRRTRMAQIPAAFWIGDDACFRIICFRSVAQYAFGVLKAAAQPGSEVGCF